MIASVLVGGINFLTAPIFTRLLGAAQYGKFSIAFSWVTILFCFMGFQTKEAVATGIHDFQNDYDRFRNSTLCLSVSISFVLVLIGMLFSGPISSFLGYTRAFLFVILLTAFMQSLWAFVQNAWIFEKKAQLNLLFSVALVLGIVSLSILFIQTIPQEKYVGRMLGFAVAYTLFALPCALALFLHCPEFFHKTYWRYSFVFGFPVVFHTLSTVVLAQCDKVMLKSFHVPDAHIGMYSWYFGLISALLIVKDALNTSWRPFYYDYLRGQDNQLLKTKCTSHIELFTAITCVFLLIVREVSLIMAGREYQQELAVMPILVTGAYFTFIYQFPVNFELYQKETKKIAAGTLSAAIANIFLNAILIPQFEIYGAGTATAISYLFLAVTHFLIAGNLKGTSYHLKPTAFFAPVLVLAVCISLFFCTADLWLVRWVIAVGITAAEGVKVLRRKSIF